MDPHLRRNIFVYGAFDEKQHQSLKANESNHKKTTFVLPTICHCMIASSAFLSATDLTHLKHHNSAHSSLAVCCN